MLQGSAVHLKFFFHFFSEYTAFCMENSKICSLSTAWHDSIHTSEGKTLRRFRQMNNFSELTFTEACLQKSSKALKQMRIFLPIRP